MSIGRIYGLGLVTPLLTLVGCSGDSSPSAPLQVVTQDVVACVEADEFVPGGASRANIVALTDPPLIEQTDPEAGYLSRNDRVIGIEVAGQYVAVPHKILWRHEIVNLELAGMPLAVTHSPLSGSSMVFDRRSVAGAAMGVADQVAMNNLVMVNQEANGQATSTWPQMERTAGCGPLNGEFLPMVTAVDITWDGWLSFHPESRVVSSDTGYGHDYGVYPYGDYEHTRNPLVYFPHDTFDERIAPKERILGVPYEGGGGIAFPFSVLQGRGSRGVFQWVAGSEPTIVLWDVVKSAAAAYRATVNGQLLTFVSVERFGDGGVIDEETGSEWSLEGVAIAGPLEGTRLTHVVEAYVSYWFAWASFVPNAFIMTTHTNRSDGNNAGKNTLPGQEDPG